MLQNLGQHIRTLRQQKGIGLNAFAERLGVSSGYLSNLETGKTDSIQMTILEKLQEEFTLLPLQAEPLDDDINYRVNRVKYRLKELEHQNPEGVDYLLATLENGLDLLLKKE
jgi:transcriptional regulator with XRE-family HTH domain